MVTNVYVDGPNLYYAALKDTFGRWLDLSAWSALLLARDIHRVRYFTAWANPGRGNPAARQRIYLRALATDPKISIHLGRCLTDEVDLADARDPRIVHKVVKVREKGVDVALATALLEDAARRDCDTAVVVTSDSDLRPTILAARSTFRIRVGVVNPRKGSGGNALREVADFHVRPDPTSYRKALLPRKLTDAHGSFTPPRAWVTR